MYFLFNSFLANIFFLYPRKTPQKIYFIFSGSYRKGRLVWNMYISKYSKYSKVTLEYKNGFIKAAFHKFYLVHSWIPWPIFHCASVALHTCITYIHANLLFVHFLFFSLNIISDKRVHNVAVNSCKPFHSRTRRGMSTQLDKDLVDFQFWSHITCCQ